VDSFRGQVSIKRTSARLQGPPSGLAAQMRGDVKLQPCWCQETGRENWLSVHSCGLLGKQRPAAGMMVLCLLGRGKS